jgi:hypothetical protein
MRRRIAAMVAMVMIVLMMSAAPAMAFHNVDHVNRSENGNKSDDGLDANKGGGQEHLRNPHPPKAGGEKHGGGDQHGGGSV